MAQVIAAPSRLEIVNEKCIFLAGTTTRTSESDWRETLTSRLSHLPVTIFNPLRPDWDSSWLQDISFAPFREQVEWELDMQDRADLIVIYFGPATQAPVSLLEFGLCARRAGRALVICHEGYRVKGNVQIVCRRFGIEFLDTGSDIVAAVVRKLGYGK